MEQTSQLDFEKARQFFADGMRQLQANNLEGAETQLSRSLEIIPDRVSTLNNLSAVKIRRQKFAEAEELAQRAIDAGDHSPEAWSNLGIARAGTNRHEEAVQAFDRALYYDSSYTMGWFNKAASLFRLKKYDEALLACDEALKLDSGQYLIYFTKSLILKELGRLEEAEKIYLRSIKMRVDLLPVVIAERRPTQKADILIISHNPNRNDLFKSFEIMHSNCSNFPGQLSRVFSDDYRFTFAIERIATRSSARRQIPPPNAVINNCTNGEVVLSSGRLPALTELIDSFGVPVINHPAKAIQTTRDASAKSLEGIPGVCVPKILRFSSAGRTSEAMVREIEDQFNYPMIMRTPAAQRGQEMFLVNSPDTMRQTLASGLGEEFFVIQFVDGTKENGFFRKLRGAVVGDEIIINRVEYSTHWNVRARLTEDRVSFYLANIYLLDIEKRICRDPEAVLGRPAIQTLREIRSRIPLDAFGIDFDMDPNGVLIFYEANATMNLFSTAGKEVAYPKEPEDRLKEAFRRYFKSLMAGH